MAANTAAGITTHEFIVTLDVVTSSRDNTASGITTHEFVVTLLTVAASRDNTAKGITKHEFNARLFSVDPPVQNSARGIVQDEFTATLVGSTTEPPPAPAPASVPWDEVSTAHAYLAVLESTCTTMVPQSSCVARVLDYAHSLQVTP